MTSRGCICLSRVRRWSDDGVCSTCGARVLEGQMTPAILLALTGGTGLVLFRNTVGYDRRLDLPYGLGPGSPDYIGWWLDGRFVGVELKTPAGKLSKEQVAWRTLMERTPGAVYAVVRTLADVADLLTRLRSS